MECAAMADKAVGAVRKQKPATTKGMDITPAWSDVMPYMVGKLMEWRGRDGEPPFPAPNSLASHP
jgi:hypothetical protein